MLPIDRQKQILTWLEKEESLRVSTISLRLHVSEMTVYRDIKPLLAENKIKKTANGIAKGDIAERTPPGSCVYCLKPAKGRLSVQIIKNDQQVENACCAHCALLRYQDIKEEVVQLIGQDFLTDTTISLKVATYLIDAEIDLNCCAPQPIVFASKENAERFQKGFEGDIFNFNEAMNKIHTEMNGSSCSCDQ